MVIQNKNNNIKEENNLFQKKLSNTKKEKYNIVIAFITFSIMCWLDMENNHIKNGLTKNSMFRKELQNIYIPEWLELRKIKDLFVIQNLWIENFEKFIEILQEKPFFCDKKYLQYDNSTFQNGKSFSENAIEIGRSFIDKIEKSETISYVL